jgi:nucleoside-diphosphate-sugar epimerase
MTSSILVTGGTGTLGRLVTPLIRNAGRRIRILSRHTHPSDDGLEFVTGDLATGEGVESAVDRVDTIVHLAGGPKGDDEKAANLVRAASSVGAPHVV